jgi:uncharacterized protein (DUF1015 family)
MALVYPFAAIMAAPGRAADVATLPYDVMNRSEAAAMAAGKDASFLRVTRSEIELPAELSPYDDAVYAKARENWLALRQEALVQDDKPAYYVYSLVMKGRRQSGIVAAASVDDYDNNIIRKHEKTRQEKEDDRTRHIATLRAQTGPVFLTYRDNDAINAAVDKTMREAPLFDFCAEDGVRHSGWRVSDGLRETIQQAFASVPLLYIADGHHRAASASRNRALLASQGQGGEADRFLSVIFPASQLQILPYNRLVFELNGHSEAEFLAAVKAVAALSPAEQAEPPCAGIVHMFFQKRWWALDLRSKIAAASSAIDQLDVSVLQNTILQPILGIDDPRTSAGIDFVGGIRGSAELEKRVNSGEAKVAFAMSATSVQQLMAIADDNAIMPPKSTWFEPKLRDGLFVHAI